MSTFCIRTYTVLLLLPTAFHGFGQEEIALFSETNLSFNCEVSNHYSMNFSLRGRYYLNKDQIAFFTQRQVDFIHFSTFTLSPRSAVSLGLMYRNRDWFEEAENELRSIFQYSIKSIKTPYRFGHRFIAEQRFLERVPQFRFRYRLALDMPLNGEKLNVNEPFLIGTTEVFWVLSEGAQPDFNSRWGLQIGWLLKALTKVQFGVEYRFESLNTNVRHGLFILSGAVFQLK